MRRAGIAEIPASDRRPAVRGSRWQPHDDFGAGKRNPSDRLLEPHVLAAETPSNGRRSQIGEICSDP